MDGQTRWWKLSRFWAALNRLGDLATVSAEWRELLGDEYRLASPFLVSTGSLVSCYPRLGSRTGPPLDLTEVEGRLVASDPTGGPSLVIEHDAALGYRVDFRKLCRGFCDAFGFERSDRWTSQVGDVRNVGMFRPSKFTRCSVFLVLSQDELPQLRAVDRLLAQAQAPFLLLTPECITDPQFEAMLATHVVGHLPLCETVAFGSNGRVSAISPADRLLLAFSQALETRNQHSLHPRDDAFAAAEDEQAFTARVNLLKAVEREVLQALFEKRVIGPDAQRQPGQKMLSQWTGYPLDSAFKASLAGLVKAGFIDNGRHHGRRAGYYLTPAGVRAFGILSES